MQRTIRLKLAPSPEQAAILKDTLEQSTACFSRVAAYGWRNCEKNGVNLHRATYYPLRSEFPRLPAQLVCAARVKATEALRSALALAKGGRKVSCPTSDRAPIRYDARTYRLLMDQRIASLATVAGRQPILFKGNPHAASLLKQAAGFDSADLILRKTSFWLHVVVTLSDLPFESNGQAVGVDLGLNRPAVASNNKFFGSRRWRETDKSYFRLRRKLQAKGTRSARRHLRKLAGKVNRFRRDCDHVLSRRIVDSLTPGTTLVVENLVNIRSTTKQRGRESRRRLHSWSFSQLRSFLQYKVEDKGCQVAGVDPRHTSQACSRCGYIHRSNRRSQSLFWCRQCGFQLNADLNASRNIAGKYLAGVGIPDSGRLLVNQPIVSHQDSPGCGRKPPALAGGG
jgi:putative transposase